MAEGRIRSWGWPTHFIGEECRRAVVVDGADHAALLEARDRIIEATAADDAVLSMAFWDVCKRAHQRVVGYLVGYRDQRTLAAHAHATDQRRRARWARSPAGPYGREIAEGRATPSAAEEP